MAPHLNPPSNWKGMLRYLGPGLIITATIVGSGELIVTPKLGAEHGFSLLWFIILGCLVKVFVQVELGRYAIVSGKTTLEAMDSIPGPRFKVGWMIWVWLLMYLSLPFQVGGMMAGLGQIAVQAGASEGSKSLWVVFVGLLTAGMLVSGRYRLVERLCIAMVVFFTLFTAYAVLSLQGSEYSIGMGDILSGLSFKMPDSFTTAFAAFGIIGVGASELIYYPYWCLEKGYGKNTGGDDGSDGWRERARGWMRVMRLDAWVSMVIYTGATIAFYLLGAAILNRQGLMVESGDMVKTLSQMYSGSLGGVGSKFFVVGAACVLFSTVFAATAANARLLSDALELYGVHKRKDEEDRMKSIKVCSVFLALFSMVLALTFDAPVWLVFTGAIAQGIMLPFLAGGAIYLTLKRVSRELRPGQGWMICLYVSAFCMAVVGIYQIYDKIGSSFGN